MRLLIDRVTIIWHDSRSCIPQANGKRKENPMPDFDNMSQWQRRDHAEERPDEVVVTIFVTPEEAAILLLADGERQGIGVQYIEREVMVALRRIEMIENIGGRHGHTACHRFTQRANARLRFAAREHNEVWIAIEQGVELTQPQWHDDLKQIAGPLASRAVQNYLADQAELEARRQRTARRRKPQGRQLKLIIPS